MGADKPNPEKAGRLSLKTGKFGAFIGCSNYPDCRFTRQFSDTGGGSPDAQTPEGKILGLDPETGFAVALKNGRFGTYLQLGEPKDYDDQKPRRSSIPKGVDANGVDLELALRLLSLPRDVGQHPETNKMITAGLGRYGPFILHDGTYANLEGFEEVFTVGINRAVTLLAEKKAGKGGRFGRGVAARQVLKDLGEHPAEGGKIEVLDGKYGAYVSHNKVNATLPKGRDPAALTVDEAIALIQERIAKGGLKPAKGGRAKAKPAANGKTAAAKPAAKNGKAPAAKAKASKPKSRVHQEEEAE